MVSERPAKRSPIGRRTLSDITNKQSQPPPKLAILKENSSKIHETTGDLLSRLLQEKATLLQIVEERNKLLEMSAAQLQNLRIRYQTLLLQNRSLAQSHSQMLADLNSGKDRLKNLQHDLMCKEALLKFRNVEPEGNPDIDPRKVVAEVKEANNDKKPCNRGRKKGTRSKSMGSTNIRADVEKEKPETKRRSLRRQSAGFVERKPEDNLFEIDDAKFAGPKSSMVDEDISEQRNEPLGETAGSSKSSMVGRPGRRAADMVQHHSDKEPATKRRCSRRQSAAGLVESHESEPDENLFEINVDRIGGSSHQSVSTEAVGEAAAEARRASMGRPLRRAAEKVCSYKEPSLNQKMRRPV